MVPQIKIVVTGTQSKDSGGIMMSRGADLIKVATPTELSPTLKPISPIRQPVLLPKRESSPNKEGSGMVQRIAIEKKLLMQ